MTPKLFEDGRNKPSELSLRKECDGEIAVPSAVLNKPLLVKTVPAPDKMREATVALFTTVRVDERSESV